MHFSWLQYILNVNYVEIEVGLNSCGKFVKSAYLAFKNKKKQADTLIRFINAHTMVIHVLI